MSKFKPGDLVRVPQTPFLMRVLHNISNALVYCEWTDRNGMKTTGRFPEMILESVIAFSDSIKPIPGSSNSSGSGSNSSDPSV